jgi:alanine dehydrogenase
MEKINVGVLKEIKPDEGRVILAPKDVKDALDISAYLSKKLVVIVETGAGLLSGYSDDEYKAAGAIIARTAEEVWGVSDLILKVKEPLLREMPLCRPNQKIMAFFHLPPLKEYIMPEVAKKNLTLFAMERFWDENGKDPLAAMSRVAGERAVDLIMNRSFTSEKRVAPENICILIIGSAGVVGSAAKNKLLANYGDARIICVDRKMKNSVCQGYHGKTGVIIEDSELNPEHLASADALILGARVINKPAPKIITEKEAKFLKNGVVIVDVAIDEGGNFYGSIPTAPSEAPFRIYNYGKEIIVYSVPNLPGTLPKVSSPLISAAILPYVKRIITHLTEGHNNLGTVKDALITKETKI